MKGKDRIIIQKIIGYIEDIEKYVEGIEAKYHGAVLEV